MQTQLQPTDYAKAIASLVGKMSLDRAAQVYEYVRFLQRQPAYPPPIALDDNDWLNDPEEQMAAEDAIWEQTLERHRDRFSALAEAARSEITAGETQPMFAEDGPTPLK